MEIRCQPMHTCEMSMQNIQCRQSPARLLQAHQRSCHPVLNFLSFLSCAQKRLCDLVPRPNPLTTLSAFPLPYFHVSRSVFEHNLVVYGSTQQLFMWNLASSVDSSSFVQWRGQRKNTQIFQMLGQDDD